MARDNAKGGIRIVPVFPPSAVDKVRDQVIAAVPEGQDGRIMVVEAAPGGPGPVLAIRKTPSWACEAVVVEHPDALAWAVPLVLGYQVRLVTVATALSEMMGLKEGQVREVAWP